MVKMSLTFISVGLFILVSTSAHSFEKLNEICERTIVPDSSRTGVNFINRPIFAKTSSLTLAAQRVREQGKDFYRLKSIGNSDQQILYETHERIFSTEISQQYIWILHSRHLVKLDHYGEVQGRYELNNIHDGARGMTLLDRSLYISSARSGLIKFDTLTHEVVWRTNMDELFRDGQRTIPVAATSDESELYIVMTGATMHGFNGVAKVDPTTGRVLRSSEYDKRRSGVVTPYPHAQMLHGHLVLNNGGWIHILNPSQLQDQVVRPRWVAVRIDDSDYPHYMMLEGDFFINDRDELLGCGAYMTIDGDRPQRHSRLFEVDLQI